MTSKIYVDELYPKTTGGAVKMPTRPIFHVTKNGDQGPIAEY